MAELGDIRSWWRPPRPTRERTHERRITFLELFHDLVYVVVVSEVAHHLAEHLDATGAWQSGLLFALTWYAWLNGALYHDLHGDNDVRTRAFTFLQMAAVIAMAVNASGAFESRGAGFALSFAAFQALLTWMWWRTGVHDPDHRPLTRPYVVTFLFTTIVFVASTLAPHEWRAVAWAGALLLNLGVMVAMMAYTPADPRIRAEHERSLKVSASIVERFDAFTIIVLGEVIVGVVRGIADHETVDPPAIATAALGMVTSIGLWWLYFDFVARRVPAPGRSRTGIWVFAQPLITLGIVASGPAVLHLVEGAETSPAMRWLLVAAVGGAMLGIMAKGLTLAVPAEHQRLYTTAAGLTAGAALAVLALGFTSLHAIPLLALVDAFLLVPVLYGLKVWIVVFDAKEVPLE